jgi:hypothetical protein
MSPAKRRFFIAELLVCFGPASLLLLLEIIFLPNQLLLLYQGFGSASWVITTFGGIAGLTGLFFLSRKIMDASATIPNRVLLWFMIAAGYAALACWLLPSAPSHWSVYELVFLILPMIASVHIIYLGRSWLL